MLIKSVRTPPSLRRIAWILILGVVVAAIYWQCVRAGFLWDDVGNILQNPGLERGGLKGVASFWRGPYLSLYIPVTYSFWTGVAALARVLAPGSPNPAPFHLANLAVHTLNAALVFLLGRRLFPKRPWAALLGAALFAAHPLQVEAVAWVTGMKDLLAATFGLIGLNVYVASIRAGSGSARHLRMAVAALCLVLALLAKPSAICLPAIAAALEWAFLGRSLRQGLKAGAVGLVISLPVILLTISAQRSSTVLLPATTLPGRMLVALDAWWFYVGKATLPLDLAIDYGRHVGDIMSRPTLVSLLQALSLLMVLGAFWALRAFPGIAALAGGALVFTLGVAPNLGFVPYEFQLISTVADRYAYLAMLGPSLALVWAATLWPRVAGVAAVGVIAVAGLAAHRQVRYWQSEEALFQHAVAVNPNSVTALDGLGVIYVDMNRPQEALASYAAALRADPKDIRTYVNVATLLTRLGHIDDSDHYLAMALTLDPKRPEVHNNIGANRLRRGDIEAAITEFETAIKIKPDYPSPLINIVRALQQQGQFDLADRYLDRLFELAASGSGTPAPFIDAGLTAQAKGRWRNAAAAFDKAVAVAPTSGEAHRMLGELLDHEGQTERAITELSRAVELEPTSAAARSSLALAFLKAKRPAEALAMWEAALAQDARFLPALVNLGALFSDQGDFTNAIKELGMAAAIQGADPVIQLNLGVALLKAGQVGPAKTALLRALALRPENPPAHFYLGDLLLQAGDANGALPHLKAAAAAYPTDKKVATLLARAEERRSH